MRYKNILQEKWFKTGTIYLCFRVLNVGLILAFGIIFSDSIARVSTMVLLLGICSHDFGLRRVSAHPEQYEIQLPITILILVLSITAIFSITVSPFQLCDLVFVVLISISIAMISINEGGSEGGGSCFPVVKFQFARILVLIISLSFVLGFKYLPFFTVTVINVILFFTTKRGCISTNMGSGLKKTVWLPAMSSYSLLSVSLQRVTMVDFGFLSTNGLLSLDLIQRARAFFYAFLPTYMSEKFKSTTSFRRGDVLYMFLANSSVTTLLVTLLSLYYQLSALEVMVCLIIPVVSTLAWSISLKLDVSGLTQISHSISIIFSLFQSLLILMAPKYVIYISVSRYLLEAIVSQVFLLRSVNRRCKWQ